jgi:hypothetical protein
MTEDYDGWTSAEMIPVIKETISMWDLLDHMEIDYPRRSHDGVKISIRDEGIPSCHIYEDGFYDYGSGVGGSVIDFYMLVKELVILTDRFMSESDPISEHWEDVLWFLEHRWAPITHATASAAGVRATKHGIWIPFWHNDEVVGVKVRGWSGVKTSMKGSSFTTGLWSPFLSPRPTKTLVLCEGESDTLALWQMLYRNILSLPYVIAGLPSGAGKWNKDWLEPWLLPDGSTTVVVMQDNDDAGKNVAEKIEDSYDRVVSLKADTDIRTDIQTTTCFWYQPLMEVLKRESA